MRRAKRPLPVPVSPESRMGGRRCDSDCWRNSRRSWSRRAAIGALSPSSSTGEATVAGVLRGNVGGEKKPAAFFHRPPPQLGIRRGTPALLVVRVGGILVDIPPTKGAYNCARRRR